jgi:hypothetical protein
MNLIAKILTLTAVLYSFGSYASVPGQVNFQGVLYDSNNLAVSGNVDFNFSLFDSLSGGTQLWTESQSSVQVNAGVYSVALGSVVPITTDILTTSAIYLEVSIGGEILSPRQRLIAVPYALKAEEADNVSGVSGIFVQQLFLNKDWDGQAIPNDDPLEGVVDTDGDGLANFIDPDNDGDSITDDVEVANGTSVNLVTPVIANVDNGTAAEPIRVGVSTLLTINGSGFLTGLTVQIGTENPVPQNVTSSSFEVTVSSAQTSSGNVALTVTNPNAEQASYGVFFYDKFVFVSSGVQANALSANVATADAFCSQAASNAGLPGSYSAWYSDPSNSNSAKDRLPTNASWARLDGTLVATDLSDLTDGSLLTDISITENGVSISNVSVATNTFSNGLLDSDSCSGSNPTQGYVGRTNETNMNWTHRNLVNCSNSGRYYCFEN